LTAAGQRLRRADDGRDASFLATDRQLAAFLLPSSVSFSRGWETFLKRCTMAWLYFAASSGERMRLPVTFLAKTIIGISNLYNLKDGFVKSPIKTPTYGLRSRDLQIRLIRYN
jgi:hypothetical protein